MKRSILVITSTLLIGIVWFHYSSPTSVVIMEPIHYQNADGSFTFVAVPEKGRDYEQMERTYAAHLSETGQQRTQLYRTTAINYLNWQKWDQYQHWPEWQYPYLSPEK